MGRGERLREELKSGNNEIIKKAVKGAFHVWIKEGTNKNNLITLWDL